MAFGSYGLVLWLGWLTDARQKIAAATTDEERQMWKDEHRRLRRVGKDQKGR